jgi:hypothetical protein
MLFGAVEATWAKMIKYSRELLYIPYIVDGTGNAGSVLRTKYHFLGVVVIIPAVPRPPIYHCPRDIRRNDLEKDLWLRSIHRRINRIQK